MTPAPVNFTSDPQIRYDRLSGRWILIVLDVPSSSGNSIGDIPNRVLIAVSDAASAGVITGTGQSTQQLTLYRAPSGALVFGAGSIQWSWGLDGHHIDGAGSADPFPAEVNGA